MLKVRGALPWLIGTCLLATLGCFGMAIYLDIAANAEAKSRALRNLSARANGLARHIESDLSQYDLALREMGRLSALRESGTAGPNTPFFEPPLTSRYAVFLNVLNESGIVVFDPRSNVVRPVDYSHRDYFLDDKRNQADIVMIGRPFGTAPSQHAAIPISRRLTRGDGGFAGIAVAGISLNWLSDLLARSSIDMASTVTIRREDGVILMRVPYDADAIGRTNSTDAPWQTWRRTGLPYSSDDSGVHLFQGIAGPRLMLELSADRNAVIEDEAFAPLWVPLLAFVPGVCTFCVAVAALRSRRRTERIEADANLANDECLRQIANASHELRAPLTGILGQADLLAREGGLSKSQASRLGQLTESAALMRNIVERTFNMSRPSEFVERLNITSCELEPLLLGCLGTVEIVVKRKGLNLSATVDPIVPRRVPLDEERLRQVLINLLMNAAKFTSRGSIAIRVTSDAGRLRFEVADSGPGIPVGKIPQLFRAYDRLGQTNRVEGNGLGLAISQRYVTQMGGRLGYRDNLGGGSVFWFEIPLADASRIAPDVAAMTQTPPAEVRNLRVLLIDDERQSRDIARSFLQLAGHTVKDVTDGETAITEAREGDFDVIVTDRRMPQVDGLEVVRRIRALPDHRARTPIVLMTGDPAAIRDGQAGLLGVDFCYLKPICYLRLTEMVASAGRLTPVPNRNNDARAVLDDVALKDVRRLLGDASFTSNLEQTTGRIEELLRLLDDKDSATSPIVRDAAHNLVGVAGLMGLVTLAANLLAFDTASDRTGPTEALREAAAAALQALRALEHSHPVRTE